jgi:hypothetical protein
VVVAGVGNASKRRANLRRSESRREFPSPVDGHLMRLANTQVSGNCLFGDAISQSMNG